MNLPFVPNLPFGLSVKLVLVNESGRSLVIQRSADSKWWPEKWDLPGGKVDPGEAFDHAMIREAKEETNLDIRLQRFIGASDWDLPHIHLVFIVMRAIVAGGDFRLSDEHQAFQWVDPAELATLDLVEPIAAALKQSTLD